MFGSNSCVYEHELQPIKKRRPNLGRVREVSDEIHHTKDHDFQLTIFPEAARLASNGDNSAHHLRNTTRIRLAFKVDPSSHNKFRCNTNFGFVEPGATFPFRVTRLIEKQSGAQVHWPSRLKIRAKTKKDSFVKVISEPANVQTAKKLISALLKLRQISPIVMTLIATVNENRADVQCLCLNQPDVIVSVNQLSHEQIQWTMKASERNDRAIFSMVERICEAVGLKNNSDHICLLSFDIRSALLNNPHGMYTLNSIRWIAFQTNTQMQFSPQGQSVVILGRPRNILQAGRFLMGLLLVSLQFNQVNDQPLDKSMIRELEDEFNVQIYERIKPPSVTYNNDTTFIIEPAKRI